tara:strand:+ start:34642 stop:36606 length:1965 start_codon:yes stop_codon:yes gene_type:complete
MKLAGPKLQWLRVAAVLFAIASSGNGLAQSSAGNFTLFDEQGRAVELHYNRLADAVVLMTHRVDSNLVAQASDRIAQTLGEFAGQDIPFFLINPETTTTRETLIQDKADHQLTAPILQDDGQLVGKTFGLNTAGEVLLIDPQNWNVVYRGPVVDDLADPKALYLRDALTALLADQTVAQATRTMPNAYAGEQIAQASMMSSISYSDTVVPILQEKCVSCHRPGGIGPWAMTSHAMVQGFSPMIREVILTKRMPPWHADPKINQFKHDMGLTTQQAQTLVQWIDEGARGDGSTDPLLAVGERETEWELGEPDLVLDLPAFTVPATGTLDYQILTVENPLDRDVWVRAVQIVPSDRQVLHHAIATFGPKDFQSGIDLGSPIGEALFQSQLMTFVPGNELYEYPERTGVLVPAGSTFFSQMHYTTYGRESTDRTKIGLYFSEVEPEFTLQHYAMLNVDLRIPPGEANYEAGAYYQFQKDAVIYSLFPHAHYRGRSSTFSLAYPDGREELVLSVPNYDFNWQRYFQLQEPIHAPAGTRLIHRTVYDNSEANLSNPDASKLVRFGEQTWEEMLYGGVSFRFEHKEDDVREVDIGKNLAGITIGYMDLNMDGKVELTEMPERMRQGLAMAFVILDKNKSGGLEFDEFQQLMMQQTRRSQQ